VTLGLKRISAPPVRVAIRLSDPNPFVQRRSS
jgi:hypothetical protein